MTPILLAFGFANLAILGWLGAAAAPILIHLWMKRVRKETQWAAVRFLQAAIKRHARRLQLQQWILLAIRTAIILLVVLAASKPMLDSLGLVGPGVRTHRLLVIDASMSMGFEAEDGPLLDRAKRLATGLIDQSRPGDVYSVATLASPPRVLLSQATSDRSRAKQAVRKVELTEGSARLAPGLAMVQRLLAQSEANAAKVDRHEVTFFTDLTATTWGELASPENESGESASLYAKLIEGAVLSVVDVGEPDAANAAVVGLRLEEAAPTIQGPVGVRANIARFDSTSDKTTVDLLVDGVTVASAPAKFGDSDSASVTFAHRFRTPGVHSLSARIGEDKLSADDRRWAASDVAHHVRVLCVEGRRGAAQYVASALNPAGSPDAPIQPEVISDAAFASIDLDDFQAVFFCNVAQLSRTEADRLRRFVERGGGAVFFLGDRVSPQRYNEVLGADAQAGVTPVAYAAGAEQTEPLLPAAIGPTVSDPQFRLDPLDYAHPIVAPFRGRERAGLITTPIARYFKLNLPEDSTTRVALATTTGDPLIITSELGRGRVAMVATDGSLTSLDPATGEPWTVMPAWPSFLPIVRGLLGFAMGDAQQGVGVLVGQPIGGLAPAKSQGQELLIRRPSGEEEPAVVRDTAGGVAWEYDRTDQSGVYQLTLAGNPLPLDAAAVNPDPRESDLSRVAASALPAELRLRSVDSDASSAGAGLVAPAGIHRGLLLAALLLVLVETFLAYWFGRAAG